MISLNSSFASCTLTGLWNVIPLQTFQIWYALLPIKFQVILTIISLKIQFLRWVVVPTFGTHTASDVKFHAIRRATYKKIQPKSSMRVDPTPRRQTSTENGSESKIVKVILTASELLKKNKNDSVLCWL